MLSVEELMLSNWGAGEDSWESLDSKEIKPVNPKGNQLWIFIGRIDAETIAPILWPPDVKSWLTGKDPDAGKTEGRRSGRQRMRWLDGITDSMDMNLSKLQETAKGQRSLVCCSPQGCSQKRLTNWTVSFLLSPTLFMYSVEKHKKYFESRNNIERDTECGVSEIP